MFESSVVESRAVASQRHFGFLTLSVAAHSAVVAGFIIAGLRSVEFPVRAPDEIRFVQLVAPITLPPPLGTPDGVKKSSAVAPPERRPVAPSEIVAPVSIPEDVPLVQQPTGVSDVGDEGGEESDPGIFGDPNGVPGGVDLGQPGGGQPANVIHRPGGEVRAARVIRRVEPIFPRIAIASRKSGVVRVRCVIDKNGTVRDPKVIFSTFNAFGQPALDAVKQWTFAPGVLHGQPVDTWFELTVTFTVR